MQIETLSYFTCKHLVLIIFKPSRSAYASICSLVDMLRLQAKVYTIIPSGFMMAPPAPTTPIILKYLLVKIEMQIETLSYFSCKHFVLVI
jgi:hypothetical protein